MMGDATLSVGNLAQKLKSYMIRPEKGFRLHVVFFCIVIRGKDHNFMYGILGNML
jgi:hypothetical protein